MNHLRRELAPISDGAWREIDAEATRATQDVPRRGASSSK